MNPEGVPQNYQDWKSPAPEGREQRPEKLFRAFSINPEELTVERLRQDLIPGRVNEDDPTKIHDGNELGVYMSTSSRMVEDAYAKGGAVGDIKTPRFDDGRTMTERILLPSCGIICEIDTRGLEIRKPQILPIWRLVYNNGFEGDEWIADRVPPEYYQVKKLILSRAANDPETLTVKIENKSDEVLQTAIDTIKQEFEKRKAAAEEFKQYLESLGDDQRHNFFAVKKGWQKWQEEKHNERSK